MRDGDQRWHRVLNHAQAVRLGLFQWGIAVLAFGTLARKERPVVLIPLTLAAFALVTAAIHKIVWWLGMDFYWDLWH